MICYSNIYKCCKNIVGLCQKTEQPSELPITENSGKRKPSIFGTNEEVNISTKKVKRKATGWVKPTKELLEEFEDDLDDNKDTIKNHWGNKNNIIYFTNTVTSLNERVQPDLQYIIYIPTKKKAKAVIPKGKRPKDVISEEKKDKDEPDPIQKKEEAKTPQEPKRLSERPPSQISDSKKKPIASNEIKKSDKTQEKSDTSSDESSSSDSTLVEYRSVHHPPTFMEWLANRKKKPRPPRKRSF